MVIICLQLVNKNKQCFYFQINIFERLQLPEDAVMPLTKNDEKKLLDMYERPYVEGAIKEQVCFCSF